MNTKATKIQIVNDRIYFVARNSSGFFVLHKVRHDSSGISYSQLNVSMANPENVDYPFQVKNYNGIPHIYFISSSNNKTAPTVHVLKQVLNVYKLVGSLISVLSKF
jgi:hypothetical protein